MPFPLIEQLAQKLNSPTAEVRAALRALIQELHNELETDNSTYLPGIGTFTLTGKKIQFTPDESLSLTVNGRYAALENELVQVEAYEDLKNSSENTSTRNEETIDKSLLDDILPQNISENTFEEGTKAFADLGSEPLEHNPFDDELLNTDRENIFSPLTSNDASDSNEALDAESMKEEDPNSNQSDQESADPNTEWTPFFEELEGDEFDIDTTIDLSADDWEPEFPSPPSSPFSSQDLNQQDDLYFDVDADPDDTLFSPSSNSNNDISSYDNDLSWAANPLEESTEFFDEEEDTVDPSTFRSPKDQTKTFSAEDEFFSPVTGSVNSGTPDDTLFSSDSLYTDDSVQEADDTIFLAPDQTVQASDGPTREIEEKSNPYAPPKPPASKSGPGKKAGSDSANPYAYRPPVRKKQSSNSWIWVAAVVVFLFIGGAAAAYFMGLPPFASGPATSTSQLPVAQNPPPSDPSSGGSETNGASDPMNTVAPGASTDPSTTDPSTASPASSANSSPVEQTPIVTRIDIDRSRGGWTIVVASETQRNEAERIADRFTLDFSGQNFPIGILSTGQFDITRYRVGVGQFDSRNDATTILNNFKADFPSDAWLLKIE